MFRGRVSGASSLVCTGLYEFDRNFRVIFFCKTACEVYVLNGGRAMSLSKNMLEESDEAPLNQSSYNVSKYVRILADVS